MTSGNAWARSFVERVFPMPEDAYRDAAESYLATLAPAFGSVKALREPMGTYRLHAQSLSYKTTIREWMMSTGRRSAPASRACSRTNASKLSACSFHAEADSEAHRIWKTCAYKTMRLKIVCSGLLVRHPVGGGCARRGGRCGGRRAARQAGPRPG